MIKQLQEKISHLQAQLTQREGQYLKKKQHYQEIITQLQNQNQKLRRSLEDHSESYSLSHVDSPSRSKVDDKQAELKSTENKLSINDNHNREFSRLTSDQIYKQNLSLKRELSQVTEIYQKQVEEMSAYFQKIKEAFVIQLNKEHSNLPHSAAASNTNSQMAMVLKAYEDIMKDFETESKKYTDKIQELTQHIIKSQEREKEIEENSRKQNIELNILREELKIFKRSKIITKD